MLADIDTIPPTSAIHASHPSICIPQHIPTYPLGQTDWFKKVGARAGSLPGVIMHIRNVGKRCAWFWAFETVAMWFCRCVFEGFGRSNSGAISFEMTMLR